MEPLLVQLLVGAYVATNGLRVLFYIPQILCVLKARDGAPAVSLATWTLWALSNATTSLYAGFILEDPFIALVSVGNTFCCGLVVAIVTIKRRRPVERASPRGSQGQYA